MEFSNISTLMHFTEAINIIQSLRTHWNLSDISGVSIQSSFQHVYVNVDETNGDLLNSIFFSTLHGSLYDTVNNNDETEENLEDMDISGVCLPNSRSNPFENCELFPSTISSTDSNIIDLTSIDDENVISLVDDRNETSAVRNVMISHMNNGANLIHDNREKIRNIRRNIRNVISNHSEDLLHFMIKPLKEHDTIKHVKQITDKLSYANFNPSASWIEKDLYSFVNENDIGKVIEHDLGVSESDLTTQIKNLHDVYHLTVTRMLYLSETLENKLNMIDEVIKSLKVLPNICESNPASLALHSSIYEYVKHEMESNNIEKDYKEFIQHYTLFMKYRNLLQLASSSFVGISETLKAPGVVCNICMFDNISHVLVPCGHTFCNNCTQKTRHSCFICRSNVNQKMRIYIH
jgi:hypothetical protein